MSDETTIYGVNVPIFPQPQPLNTSGIHPCEFKVLVAPDDTSETDPTLKKMRALGLEVVDKTTEREKMKQVHGTLIAVGGNAFDDWKEPIPRVGDRVMFAKFAGLVVNGKSGQELRLLNDKDLVAVVQEA